MQETFLSVYKHRDSISEGSVKAYLAQTALNKSRDHLRKNIKKIKVPLEEAEDLSTGDTVLTNLLNEEILEKIGITISLLSEPYKDIAFSYYIKGEAITDYAKRNNLKVKTAQTRLRRAREKMKILFRKEYGDG